MRICTVTCHDVYNHGASLQAFALQHYLEGLGHDVRIIDYKPPYLSGDFSLMTVSNPRFDVPVVRWLYRLAKLPGRLAALPRKRSFDAWTARWLSVTAKRYGSNEELAGDCPQADAFVAGSDQIWNTRFPNGLDPTFYLSFAPLAARRISYAASFAYPDIEPEHVPFVASHLANFDAISVREASGVPLLGRLGYEGVQVVDPVFLLSAGQWRAMSAATLPCEPHIVVYDFENSPEIRNVAERIAAATGAKIWSVGPYRLPYAHRNFHLAGPDVFVGAISDAQCVLSNSFHGTAFAMIFGRDFFVLRRSDGLNERMESLLVHYGLPERLVCADVPDDALLAHIDYGKVAPVLATDVARSQQWLASAL